ncbi:hypothetical protein [Sphingomonas sp. Leaf343]|uniref:hypothetical protein n=1 Tax=Sphingomonas sp. Leaf343 TaxID=1736345 RepID=UPI0006F75ECB|nr:hypothetical protein [Sphingomonas sp. Leaf343]KQR87828.1 hypothetical protein ASG07_02875 [Sphingomonas sp. Leaf343]
MSSFRHCAVAGLVLFASPAAAQTDPVRPPATDLPKQPDTEPAKDIIVEGTRDLNADPPVSSKTLNSGRLGAGSLRSRRTYEMADRFARCSIRSDMNNKAALRQALDGAINGAKQKFWQGRFIGLNASCALDTRMALEYGVATIDDAYDTSYYDRGVMFLRALGAFAPDLELTKAQTSDPKVQARFNARETPLARFRLPVDMRYFEIAICLVRLQPEQSVRLIRTEGIEAVNRLEGAIVNATPICTGGAKKVYFDPAQFRMYIADAVYRWAVAARGVDSLIPAGD